MPPSPDIFIAVNTNAIPISEIYLWMIENKINVYVTKSHIFFSSHEDKIAFILVWAEALNV